MGSCVVIIGTWYYSWESQLVFNSPVGPGFQWGDPLHSPQVDPRGAHHFSKFTTRAVLRYKPDNNNTFYASYSQGFKSGYVNNSNINACTPSPACIDAPVRGGSTNLDSGISGLPA